MCDDQGCEPKTESRFFGRFLTVVSDKKLDFFSRFWVAQKEQNRKTGSFLSVGLILQSTAAKKTTETDRHFR